MPWPYEIDWNGTGAMVQAVGSVGAILVAVCISRAEIRQQRQAADEDLWSRRRAAWKTLYSLVGVISRKNLIAPTELAGITSILDRMDLSVFPEDATPALVGFYNRVSMLQADVAQSAAFKTERVSFSFNAEAEFKNLDVIRASMGVEPTWPGRGGK